MSTHIKCTHTARSIPEAPIKETLVLPCCWVCRKLFIDSRGTDPSIIREEHHPVPRAYGGLNGPTVSVCSGHHGALHAIADKMIAADSIEPQYFMELITGMDYEPRMRLLYLAKVVYGAWRATKDDPNKRSQVSAVLTGEQTRKLAQLTSFYGLSSNQKTLAVLIEQDYARNFPSLPKTEIHTNGSSRKRGNTQA